MNRRRNYRRYNYRPRSRYKPRYNNYRSRSGYNHRPRYRGRQKQNSGDSDWGAGIFALAILSIPLVLALLPLLIIGGIVWLIIRAKRQQDHKADNPQDKPLEEILPNRNYFLMKEGSVNHYWSRAFYDNLEKFTAGAKTSTDQNNGLIYYYVVDDQIRYIGQTRENSLSWRMTKHQSDGRIGYNMHIKRNLLQAASEGRLAITTKAMPKSYLDGYEKAEIEKYAPTNNLWNQEHNPEFSPDNFYV